MHATSLPRVGLKLHRWSVCCRSLSSSTISDTITTHSTNLSGLQSFRVGGVAGSAAEQWHSWLAGNGSAAAAALWHTAQTQQDWHSLAFLSYALWYHDGVPAVHVQAARWASWDLAVAAVKSAPQVSPSSGGADHAAFTAACTVLHMLAPRKWGKLPVSKPALWLQRAAASPEPTASHPWLGGFSKLAYCQSAPRQEQRSLHDMLQQASCTGLLPASHAYAVHLRAAQGKPLLNDLAGFFDQSWASLARAAASSGWAPSGVLLGQSLLQIARKLRREGGASNEAGAFKQAVQLQRKGAEFLHTAASSGSIDAAAALGVMLRSGGAGMAPHPQEAQRLLHRAAAHGHVNAMFHLALMLKASGSIAQYEHWLEQASRGGHAAAQSHLAKAKPQLAEDILSGNTAVQH